MKTIVRIGGSLAVILVAAVASFPAVSRADHDHCNGGPNVCEIFHNSEDCWNDEDGVEECHDPEETNYFDRGDDEGGEDTCEEEWCAE